MVRRGILLLLVAGVIGTAAAFWLLQNSISNISADLAEAGERVWLAPGGDLGSSS